MIDIIKEVVKNSMNYASLPDVVFGTVVGINPLKVRLDNMAKIDISEPFLIITQRLKNTSWSANERLVLIKALGGQNYIILDKL